MCRRGSKWACAKEGPLVWHQDVEEVVEEEMEEVVEEGVVEGGKYSGT